MSLLLFLANMGSGPTKTNPKKDRQKKEKAKRTKTCES
jgi:hypothetical protein